MTKTPVNFRLDGKLVAHLKKIAEYENRSLTNLIETELIRFAKLYPTRLNLVNAIKKAKKT